MTDDNHPGYPPAGPGLPPGDSWRRALPPRPRRSPAHLLTALIVTALFIGVTVGAGRAVWQAVPAPLPLSPWAPSQSAASPPQHTPGLSGWSASASALRAGVVDIDTQLGYQDAAGAGTGIVLSRSGEVLTNNHVISGATRIRVTDVSTGRSYPATVTGYDRSHDVALLQVQGASGLPTASIGDSSTVSVGDEIAAVGNAGGVGGPPSIAPGRVSALDRTIIASDAHGRSTQQLTDLIQIAADVVPGDSGGPLLNTAGQVVGMDTAATMGFRFESARGEGFAIPINEAINIAKHIESGSGSDTVHVGPTGVLGIVVQDTNAPAPLGPSSSDSAGPGAIVVGVLPSSPGDQAGLAAGDIIVSADGTATESATTLTTVLNHHHPGDPVELTWLDPSGQQHDATVRLATGPPN